MHCEMVDNGEAVRISDENEGGYYMPNVLYVYTKEDAEYLISLLTQLIKTQKENK